MFIREQSDLHLEICKYHIPPMVGDEASTLILSGDICTAHKLGEDVKNFFENASTRFKHIVYVPGNHENYREHIGKVDTKIREFLKVNEYDNVHYLNQESVVLDGVAFIGATLWTDVNKGNPIAQHMIEAGLNDYKAIRIADYRKLRARDTILLHIRHKQFIFDEVARLRALGHKTVVVSHHAPSALSIHPQYKGDPLNDAYYSDMADEVMDKGPDLWTHGHMHHTFDYELGATRVICNPRGYTSMLSTAKHDRIPMMRAFDPENPDQTILDEFNRIYVEENASFNPYLRIEL